MEGGQTCTFENESGFKGWRDRCGRHCRGWGGIWGFQGYSTFSQVGSTLCVKEEVNENKVGVISNARQKGLNFTLQTMGTHLKYTPHCSRYFHVCPS